MSAGSDRATSLILGSAPDPGRWWTLPLYWLIQLLVVGAICAVGYALYFAAPSRGFSERLLLGAVMSLPANLLVFAASMLFWVPWMQKRPVGVVQKAALDGETLRISLPRPLDVDLGASFAAEITKAPSGSWWAVTFMPEEGRSVTLTVEAHEREERRPHAIRSFHQPSAPQGSLEERLRFGDSLLTALDAHSDQNRFVTWTERLDAFDVSPTQEPFLVEVPQSQGATDPYRAGRVTPHDAGFAEWAARNGLVIAPGVTLCPEHLLIERRSGLYAIPLGASKVELPFSDKFHTSTVLKCVDEMHTSKRVSFEIADGAARVALVRWLAAKNEAWAASSAA